MSNDFSRRQFFRRIGAAASASLPLLNVMAEPGPRTLPHRELGGNGVKVPILAFGCGSRFLMYEDEDKALEALNHAIDPESPTWTRLTLTATARVRRA